MASSSAQVIPTAKRLTMFSISQAPRRHIYQHDAIWIEDAQVTTCRITSLSAEPTRLPSMEARKKTWRHERSLILGSVQSSLYVVAFHSIFTSGAMLMAIKIQ